MRNNLKTSKVKLWIATATSYLFFMLFIYVQLENVELPSFIYGFGVGAQIGTVLLLISDIFENNVYNKWFWFLSMLITTPFSVMAYMVQREKLIKLGNGFRVSDSR